MFPLLGASAGPCRGLLSPLEVLVSILLLSFMTPVDLNCLAFELVKVGDLSSLTNFSSNILRCGGSSNIP
jgi:hypothetical protein